MRLTPEKTNSQTSRHRMIYMDTMYVYDSILVHVSE